MKSDVSSRAMAYCAFRFAVVAAMWVLVVAGVTTFSFFYIMTPTRWFYANATEMITWRNSLVLQYIFVDVSAGKATPLLTNTYSFIIIWQWCATLAAALGAAGLLWAYSSSSGSKTSQPETGAAAAAPTAPTASDALSYETSSSGSIVQGRKDPTRNRCSSYSTRIAKGVVRVRRLIRCQVPPRGLWRKILGPDGLSVLDLLLLLLWFGLHIMWLREMTMKTLDTRWAPSPLNVATTTTKTTTVARSNTTVLSNATQIFNSSLTGISGTNTSSGSSGSGSGSSSSSSKSTTTTTSTSTSTSARSTTLKPLPREVQNSMAKYTGMVGNFDLLLLFFPLPRCNFLHWLLQSDFPALVKYHRWLGHGTLLMYSLHGIIYMSLWTKDGTLSTNMQWTMNSYVNNIAGLISLIAGWVIWITSIPYIRRHFFNLFYSSHIAGTVMFMLFAFMHRKDIAPWVMPGIFLYLLDVVLRTLQQAFNSTVVTAVMDPDNITTAASASISPHGNILTLTIQCDKSLTWAGLDIVFLNIPEISWWQWHPFTLATSSVAGGPQTKMVLHIKTYNHWTQRLVARLATSAAALKLYVSGPYHGAHRKWITNFDRHIFIAGGIGVTPALGMLQDLIARRRKVAANPDAPPSGRVILIWLSRSRDELATLPYGILQEASRSGPDAWLDLQLYLTSEEHSEDDLCSQEYNARPEQNAIAGGLNEPSGGSKAVRIPFGCLEMMATATLDKITTPTTTARSSNSSNGSSSKCGMRPLAHPYMLNPLLWVMALVLCFGGGFAGFICSQAYDAHIARQVALRNDYTHVGMLQFAAFGLGSTLPPAILMLVVHLYLEVKSRRPPNAATVPAAEDTRRSTPEQHLNTTHGAHNTLYVGNEAGTCAAACRTATTSVAYNARSSVNSIATYLSDDITTFCDSAAATKAAVQPTTTMGTTTTGTQPAVAKRSTTLFDNGEHISAEPFIKHGRPELTALLETVARTGSAVSSSLLPTLTPEQKQQQQDAQNHQQVPAVSDPSDPSNLRVAVFVAGPRRLVEAVEECCARLNGAWGRPRRCYLEAHPLTHEL